MEICTRALVVATFPQKRSGIVFSSGVNYLHSDCSTDPIRVKLVLANVLVGGRRGGLMVSALDSGVSGPGSSPGWEYCIVFLGKTLYSHSASLDSGV